MVSIRVCPKRKDAFSLFLKKKGRGEKTSKIGVFNLKIVTYNLSTFVLTDCWDLANKLCRISSENSYTKLWRISPRPRGTIH
jgi:hypothetical protein